MGSGRFDGTGAVSGAGAGAGAVGVAGVGASGAVGVAGVGAVVPAGDLGELSARLAKGGPLVGERRGFGVPHTSLPPVEPRVGLCPDPPAGPTRPHDLAVLKPRIGAFAPENRKIAVERGPALPRESSLAVAVAAAALAGPPPPAGDQVAVVWVTSTAGMQEYGQLCVEAATLDPGLVSPLTGPQSAYNGPAAAVSMRYGLTGPQLTLTGGPQAGAAAVAEAARMLDEGRCAQVLLGGSATLSRWRLAGAPPGLVPAEGAVCLRLARVPAAHTSVQAAGITARLLRRGRLPAGVDGRSGRADRAGDRGSARSAGLAHFVAQCLALMAQPPASVVLSTTDPDGPGRVADALRDVDAPCRHVEWLAGEFGAAGGLLAVVAAIAACGPAEPAASPALVLALGDAGQAVAIEVLATPARCDPAR